jgi:4-hydroxy-2-oxoheptanedioate aldolase
MATDGYVRPLQARLAAGGAVFGGWCVIPNSFSAEVLAQRGFDWVGIDWQHGFIDLEQTGHMIQAISLGGAAPFIRLTFNEPWIIGKALDLGAFGVIVPLVNSRAEAEQAVAACRYPPAGIRSFGPLKNAPVIGTDAALVTERVYCFVMIESSDGYENLEQICQTPGLDGVFIGPDDLRISMVGPAGTLDSSVIERILSCCRENNIICGIHTPDGNAARAAAERGYSFIAIGSDADFLAYAAADAVLAAHGGDAHEYRQSLDGTVQAIVWSGL